MTMIYTRGGHMHRVDLDREKVLERIEEYGSDMTPWVSFDKPGSTGAFANPRRIVTIRRDSITAVSDE